MDEQEFRDTIIKHMATAEEYWKRLDAHTTKVDTLNKEMGEIDKRVSKVTGITTVAISLFSIILAKIGWTK